jgi:ABC-2 type transport system ATP-binding protein
MRQRLAIAGALLMPRELLFLDEPTNGLDPQGTREVRALIGSLGSEGTTVLVSRPALRVPGLLHLRRRPVAQGPMIAGRGHPLRNGPTTVSGGMAR